MPAGKATLRFEFAKTGENRGSGALYINDKKVGEGEIPHTVPIAYSLCGEGLCCGYGGGVPVTDDYRPPFTFTGRLYKVVVDVIGKKHRDEAMETSMAMSRQ